MTKRSFFAAGTASFLGLVGLAPRAKAEHRIPVGHGQLVRSGRAKCGCPINSRRVCTGYDKSHNPIYTTYREPFVCGCNKQGKHGEALRKFQERRAKENLRYEERLQKEYRDYQKTLDKIHRWHQKEIEDIHGDYEKAAHKH